MCYTIDCDECEEPFDFDSDNFIVTNSGNGFDGEQTHHWAEGYVICPHCGNEIEHSESFPLNVSVRSQSRSPIRLLCR